MTICGPLHESLKTLCRGGYITYSFSLTVLAEGTTEKPDSLGKVVSRTDWTNLLML